MPSGRSWAKPSFRLSARKAKAGQAGSGAFAITGHPVGAGERDPRARLDRPLAVHVLEFGAGAFDERAREAGRVSALLSEHIAALRQHGFDVPIVSGSGTGTHSLDLAAEPFTEIQAGSYVFMDADYARIRGECGEGLPFECSLYMLATVTSANRPGQVTLDAGTKSLAVNGPAPHLLIGAPEGSRYEFAGDEHGILLFPEKEAAPRLGDRLLMSVTHCDPTVNLFSVMHAVKQSGEVENWPVVGRN